MDSKASRSTDPPTSSRSKDSALQAATATSDNPVRAAAKPTERTASTLLPSVTIPKGGGAIRGLGEKFTTNPVTGTASLSIPIATSPGRAGFDLALSLSYDSGNGNGPFGVGWQLSVPFVTRKSDKGLARYLDSEDHDSDVFLLAGAEDLVPAQVLRAGTMVFDAFDSAGYRVQRFAPRTEGLFARIERWTRQSDGDAHWQVRTRDNVLHVYGRTATSRVADPGAPERVYAWLLEETRDDRGSVVRYGYRGEDGAAVPESVSEAHRFSRRADGASHFVTTSQRYLKHIQYANRTPARTEESAAALRDDDFAFEVVFDYGEHDDHEPAPRDYEAPGARSWRLRDDPFSSYRAGFEVRTYRLCQRVLMFHRFADELGDAPSLVRTTAFTYEGARPSSADGSWAGGPVVTCLSQVVQRGHRRPAAGTPYQTEELPPLELSYAQARVFDNVQSLDPTQLDGLRGGTDGSAGQWVDLFGVGIPGVLIPTPRAWYYKENEGEGRLAPPALLRSLPSPAELGTGGQQLSDLNGDGVLELVQYARPMAGYFERTQDGQWGSFVSLPNVPNLDFGDPNLRFLDLDGDGHADLLISEHDAFVWYRSRAKAGFEAPAILRKPNDEDAGPAILFADGTETIQLADMSGDGLVDLVRLRNGESCYWPNLGYGRFGRKVTLDGSPRFDAPDHFDPKRIRLFDLDGSGPSDIVYLGREHASVYFNQSGNALSAPLALHGLPALHGSATCQPVDLLGQGTACLVWSSSLPSDELRSVFYLDLFRGTKPYLLTHVQNNLGAETTLSYVSSTKFYLADKAAGRPWITRLSFPVHVVEGVERVDHVANTRLVTRNAYSHGYYDPDEREFRGFARVEQWDAEALGGELGKGLFDPLDYEREDGDSDLDLPPVRTITWFHTGAWLERERIEAALAREYYVDETASGGIHYLLADTALEPVSDGSGRPVRMSALEEREATRALRGQVLRQEIYAEDGSERARHPYTVSERSYRVRRLQEKGTQAHGVFLTYPSETLSLQYERRPLDPRVTHELTLLVDDFGNVRRKASVAYPRPSGDEPHEQAQDLGWVSVEESDLAHATEDPTWYRHSVPVCVRQWEVGGLSFTTLLTAEQLAEAFDAPESSSTSLRLEEPGKRLLAETLSTYKSDDQARELGVGALESLALPHTIYKLAFSDAQWTELWPSVVPEAERSRLMLEAGYARRDTAVYARSEVGHFAPEHFFLPVRAVDPFDSTTSVGYDRHSLFVVEARDPLLNTTSLVWDYQSLSPRTVTDPNANSTQVLADALGRVVAIAMRDSEGRGDSLEAPSSRFSYDVPSWTVSGRPARARSEVREIHGAADSRWLVHLTYSDGAGQVVMEKATAEPGPAWVRTPEGVSLDLAAAPRWITSGRIVRDNKGNAVKQYEPYFWRSDEFEREADLTQFGVTPVLRYDPLGRLVQADLPDGTRTRVDFDSWTQVHYDGNDLVVESRWQRAVEAQRRPPTSPLEPDPASHSLRVALSLSGSPGVMHLDTLGRVVASVADNRARDGAGTLLPYDPTDPARTELISRSTFDLRGQARELWDARGVCYARQDYDLLGRRYRLDSVDAGVTTTFVDVNGSAVLESTANGLLLEQRYDALRRPLELLLRRPAGDLRMRRWVYGESHPNAASLNLRGRLFRTFDGAGLLTHQRYDFEGNLELRTRALLARYAPIDAGELAEASDWSSLAGVERVPTHDGTVPRERDPLATAELPEGVQAQLEQRAALAEEITYDALKRPVREQLADGSTLLPTYNDAGLLQSLHVAVANEAAPRVVLANVSYNERAQRLSVEYGGDASGSELRSHFSYDDLSFRLVNVTTTRRTSPAKLQDLSYRYDAVGNVTSILDASSHDALPGRELVSANRYFSYDGLSQLIAAWGREIPLGLPNWSRDGRDAQALRRYREHYKYDRAGNFAERAHRTLLSDAYVAGLTQHFEVDDGQETSRPQSNRLYATQVDGSESDGLPARFVYPYDAAGNMLALPHLAHMRWTPQHRLGSIERAGSLLAHYAYDADGERVRKVVVSGGIVREHVYFNYYEVYREWSGDALRHARETLNITDGARRVLLVERELPGGDRDRAAVRMRFQLGDHLESVGLEVDEIGRIISYEEYLPYGETAVSTQHPEVSRKRYRYTGKESDEESGLNYHSARYYAPWLGRWCSADPIMADNLSKYASNAPTARTDRSGMEDALGETHARPRVADILAGEVRARMWNGPADPAERRHYLAERDFFSALSRMDLGPAGVVDPSVIHEDRSQEHEQKVIQVLQLAVDQASAVLGPEATRYENLRYALDLIIAAREVDTNVTQNIVLRDADHYLAGRTAEWRDRLGESLDSPAPPAISGLGDWAAWIYDALHHGWLVDEQEEMRRQYPRSERGGLIWPHVGAEDAQMFDRGAGPGVPFIPPVTPTEREAAEVRSLEQQRLRDALSPSGPGQDPCQQYGCWTD